MQKILIVDDLDLNRRLLRQVLELHGYEILESVNGEDGLKLTREQRPDLILMDIQMPVMNGFVATRILKSDPATRDIPIIALTSYAMKGDREKSLAAGMDDYISKPVNIRELPIIVKKHLQPKTLEPSA